jgi:glc operon protein GlcG
VRYRVLALTALALALGVGVTAATAPRLTAAPAPRPGDQQTATVPEASISLSLAVRMLEAMERRATEMGVPVGLAIVDQSGRLKAFHRMDGSRPNHIDSAMNKAWTSVQYGRDNGELWERVQANPALFATVANVPHVDFTAGGRLLRVNGLVIGALGVAGGVAGQDDIIGDAALALLPQ